MTDLDGFTLRAEYLAPPMRGVAFRVNAGECFQIIDVKGQQVGDLVAFNASDPEEYFSPSHTVTQNWRVALRVGDVLASNRRNNMMRIVADTVGYHDLIVPCCDPEAYLKRYGLKDHRSCKANMEEALAAIQIDWPVRGENAWNIFMKNEIQPDGKMVYLEPTHGPGSSITLDALMDMVIALSACPQDQTPTNGWNCTEMLVKVWKPG
jgi:uncharacterized protein YcgI (DUF1989 family)